MALVRYTEEENKYLEKLIASKGNDESAADIATKFCAKYPERTVAAVQQRIFKTLKPKTVSPAKNERKAKAKAKPLAAKPAMQAAPVPAPTLPAAPATIEVTLPSGARLSGSPKQVAEVLSGL